MDVRTTMTTGRWIATLAGLALGCLLLAGAGVSRLAVLADASDSVDRIVPVGDPREVITGIDMADDAWGPGAPGGGGPGAVTPQDLAPDVTGTAQFFTLATVERDQPIVSVPAGGEPRPGDEPGSPWRLDADGRCIIELNASGAAGDIPRHVILRMCDKVIADVPITPCGSDEPNS